MQKEVLKEVVLDIKSIDIFSSYLKSIIKNGDIIIMEGGLGYGKTTLIRNLVKLLDSSDIVTSPSFTLINEYNICLNGVQSVLRHIDLYRLSSYDDLDNIGLMDIISSDGISAIEWGDKFIKSFNPPYYILEIEMKEESTRLYRLIDVK